jgi:hypothetical protein
MRRVVSVRVCGRSSRDSIDSFYSRWQSAARGQASARVGGWRRRSGREDEADEPPVRTIAGGVDLQDQFIAGCEEAQHDLVSGEIRRDRPQRLSVDVDGADPGCPAEPEDDLVFGAPRRTLESSRQPQPARGGRIPLGRQGQACRPGRRTVGCGPLPASPQVNLVSFHPGPRLSGTAAAMQATSRRPRMERGLFHRSSLCSGLHRPDTL